MKYTLQVWHLEHCIPKEYCLPICMAFRKDAGAGSSGKDA
jgi:hypothetical protein